MVVWSDSGNSSGKKWIYYIWEVIEYETRRRDKLLLYYFLFIFVSKNKFVLKLLNLLVLSNKKLILL